MGKTDRVRVKSDRDAKPAEIGVLIYPGVQVSAVGGLTDLFATANRLSVERSSADARTLRISHWKLKRSSEKTECIYDTHGGEHKPLVALILPPSLDFDPDRDCDAQQEQWIREQHFKGTVVCSICAGAFLLGGTGLLNGRSATTHWIHAADLAERFPQVRVNSDKLIIDDGDIMTAGGVCVANS